MDVFKRIKKLNFSPSYSRTLSILSLLILVAAVPLTVFLSQQQQDIRQRASECREICDTQEECLRNNDQGECEEYGTVQVNCRPDPNCGSTGNNNGNQNPDSNDQNKELENNDCEYQYNECYESGRSRAVYKCNGEFKIGDTKRDSACGSSGGDGRNNNGTGSERSSDGQTLSGQSDQTKKDFRSKYCGNPNRDCVEARKAWAADHDREIKQAKDNNPENDSPAGECSSGDYKRRCTGDRENCGASSGESEIYLCESGKWSRKNNECRSECASRKEGYFKEGQQPGSDTRRGGSDKTGDGSSRTPTQPPAQNPSDGYCSGTQWCDDTTGACAEDPGHCGTDNTQRCMYTDLNQGNNTCYLGECKDSGNCGFNKGCTPNETNFGVASYCPGQAPSDYVKGDPGKLFNFCRQAISYKSNQKMCDVNGDGKYDEEDLKTLQVKVPTPTVPPSAPSGSSNVNTGNRNNTGGAKTCSQYGGTCVAEADCNIRRQIATEESVCGTGNSCCQPESEDTQQCKPGDQGSDAAGKDALGNNCWKDWRCNSDDTKHYDPVRCDAGQGATCEYFDGTCGNRPRKCFGFGIAGGCVHGPDNCERCEPVAPANPESGYICYATCTVDMIDQGAKYCKQGIGGCTIPNIFDCTQCKR